MTDYEMQVLLALAKQCKPNSPYPGRAWTHVSPISGTPEFGNALSALIRMGLLERGFGYRVKPTQQGYFLIYELKARRQAMRQRPPLYARRVWDVDLSV